MSLHGRGGSAPQVLLPVRRELSPAAGRGAIFCRLFAGVRRAADALCAAQRPHGSPEHDAAPAANSTLLSNVRVAVRLGFLAEAEAMLVSAGGLARDPERLNLLGVIYEARRHWKLARRYYGKAIRVDSRYEPAQQNMRRIYELHTFGRSAEPVALGDERRALALLLKQSPSGTPMNVRQ